MKAFLKNEEESMMVWANKGAFSTLHDFKKYLEQKYPNMKIMWIK